MSVHLKHLSLPSHHCVRSSSVQSVSVAHSVSQWICSCVFPLVYDNEYLCANWLYSVFELCGSQHLNTMLLKTQVCLQTSMNRCVLLGFVIHCHFYLFSVCVQWTCKGLKSFPSSWFSIHRFPGLFSRHRRTSLLLAHYWLFLLLLVMLKLEPRLHGCEKSALSGPFLKFSIN